MQGRNRYVLLCVVDRIGEGGVELSHAFARAHGCLRDGERVCLRIVPVTEDGFAGRARVVMCDAELAAVEVAECEASNDPLHRFCGAMNAPAGGRMDALTG